MEDVDVQVRISLIYWVVLPMGSSAFANVDGRVQVALIISGELHAIEEMDVKARVVLSRR